MAPCTCHDDLRALLDHTQRGFAADAARRAITTTTCSPAGLSFTEWSLRLMSRRITQGDALG
jgi:hypothetical protein